MQVKTSLQILTLQRETDKVRCSSCISACATIIIFHFPLQLSMLWDLIVSYFIHMQVMVKRQRTAFPPNFVHSLDGSHMMMTAIACKKAGLNFAGLSWSLLMHMLAKNCL